MTPLDDYIHSAPPHLFEILDYLHTYVQSFDDKIKASIKWKIPFYTRKKHIGYLNIIHKKTAVELIFVRAHRFDKAISILLDKKDRKYAAGISFTDLSEIKEDVLSLLINEAVRVDEEVEATGKGYW